MTVTAAHLVTTDQEEMTAAEMAMAVAVAYALAAESNVTTVLEAWLAGRFDRVTACYAGAQKILQAIAKAILAGEHYAGIEWNVRPSPKIIPSTEHQRLTRALDTITRDHAGARVADLISAITPNETDTAASAETMINRATRLASAETIRAGRLAYGQAVAEAVGDDPDYVWTFTTDANPCPKCVVLASKSFPSFDAAPNRGAHPNCACVLSVELREKE